ncbi:amino acid adenylation domain-containing protein [Amycolatopsis australiensis]|uniref:Amino acid adenylation domain-containing protein n=1 Tax=Amycolatopsis australiensis TaxID=546364 RepID=A0A1K1SBH1_9PSEU|nr:amino acid adenylation domain-containing protein [Amycolatopsis australiensis]SFW81399.1 amino acid adenylation domain-containing protein [Amycolatopsis australiensis]
MLTHQHFFAQARRTPGAVALVEDDGGSITYGALSHVAAALARRLGDGSGRVAVVSRKRIGTVAAFLACLRAGRAYVPIDPAHPRERHDFVLADAGCSVLLDAEDLDLGALLDEPDGEPAPVRPDDEAYVLYTSGSTGTPKGVVITHRNAAAFTGWAAAEFPLTADDRVAVHAPLHFDLPVYDLYAGLRGGAELHLVPERTALFPAALGRLLRERRITSLYAVPTALAALARRGGLAAGDLPALRQILFAGEEFRTAALAELMALVPGAAAANLYGPIETNVVTAHRLPGPPEPDSRLPIGRPVTGAVIGLRDPGGRIRLDGEGEGELVVAGDCVTPGYLGRPDLTAAAIVHSGHRRFYRTGDIARRAADGSLQLLGRADGLVKTRGYRVELGDIEAHLAAHPGVDGVAVVAIPDPATTHRLEAAVVPRPGTDGDALPADLLRHCRARLPHYMVPNRVHVLTALPTTSTGKTAKRALAEALGVAGGPR